MRFFALLKKELRECLPWIILAAIIILAWAGLLLRYQANLQANNWAFKTFHSEVSISTIHPQLQDPGIILFLTSIGLGLALSFQQYWLPGFRGIWPFLLHRSIHRDILLWAKIVAGAFAFVISCGLVWALLYLYSSQPGVFWTPMPIRFLFEGWLFVFLGFMVYLAAALCGLSSARWYTTKIIGLAFAVVVSLAIIGQWQLKWVVAILVIGMLIILTQLFDTFLNKEF
jgi:hypothetical protein